MLSILIPIYNYDVTKLVERLHKQCDKTGKPFEIICFDDYSKPSFKKKNQVLRTKFLVNYVELSENLGRAKIRNWLAKAAQFEKMLFIDCDSKVPGKNYVQNYLNLLNQAPVIYGGRKYSKKAPTSQDKFLHWKYGSSREALTVRKRKKRPYLNFMSNNFVIDRALFQQIPFDESLEQYGYEDTLMAEQLKVKDIKILHIDNPLEHKGLEPKKTFLRKVAMATENLSTLYQDKEITSSRLIDFYLKAKSYGFDNAMFSFVSKRKEKILKNLLSEKPSLRYLDLYKLYLFMTKVREGDLS